MACLICSGLTLSDVKNKVIRKNTAKKIKTITTMNPIATSLGDSCVDVVEVLLSIVALVLVSLLKVDDMFLGCSVLGVFSLTLTD